MPNTSVSPRRCPRIYPPSSSKTEVLCHLVQPASPASAVTTWISMPAAPRLQTCPPVGLHPCWLSHPLVVPGSRPPLLEVDCSLPLWQSSLLDALVMIAHSLPWQASPAQADHINGNYKRSSSFVHSPFVIMGQSCVPWLMLNALSVLFPGQSISPDSLATCFFPLGNKQFTGSSFYMLKYFLKVR